MRIVHWNITKKSDNLTGIARYENELFQHLKKYDIEITRILRYNNRIIGNTIISWLLRYHHLNADIVHATFPTLAPAAVIHKNNKNKMVVTVHDIRPVRYPSVIMDIAERIQWLLTPRALNKIDKLIAISEFTKNELIKLLKIDNDKISVTHLGVNHLEYHAMNKSACKKKFCLSEDFKYILVVSSNLPHKRMDLARKIMERIHERRKDIIMLKVGYGQSLFGKGIKNLGWISESDMPALYNAADVYLHTSEYEGFGLPILEAMACGLPVVASNKASIPEILENTGHMVDIDSSNCVQTFSEIILEVIDEGIDRREIEQSKKFTWEKTAEGTINIYKELSER